MYKLLDRFVITPMQKHSQGKLGKKKIHSHFSPEMLKEIDCKWVIIGHLER